MIWKCVNKYIQAATTVWCLPDCWSTEELLWPGNRGTHGGHHVYAWSSAIHWPPSGLFSLMITQRSTFWNRILLKYDSINLIYANISMFHSWSRDLESSMGLSCMRTAWHAHNSCHDQLFCSISTARMIVKMWGLTTPFYYCKLICVSSMPKKFQIQ